MSNNVPLQFELDAFACPRILRIAYNAPIGTELGEHGDCDVAIYATPVGTDKAQLIGGVTAQAVVPRPCHLLGRWLAWRVNRLEPPG